jgi:hypothetical protein
MLPVMHGSLDWTLVLETVAKIRRAYLVQKKPIKAIGRELRGLARGRAKVLRWFRMQTLVSLSDTSGQRWRWEDVWLDK